MRGRVRRASRPSLERFEGRQLPSGLIPSMIASHPEPSAASLLSAKTAQAVASAQAAGAAIGATTTTTAATDNNNTGGVGNGNGLSNNDQSPLLGSGTPTAQELNREAYKAVFAQSRYYTGPGRFSDQGTTYYYRGLGGSTFFLHGDFNMAVVTPTDPTKPFVGVAVMNDKNTNSQGTQALDLVGSRTAVDSLGRPTQLTFTADPNIYSGVFYTEAAQGTVNIKYGKGPNSPVSVTFSGLVYTSGLTSPLVNQDLYSRGGRPLRFHP